MSSTLKPIHSIHIFMDQHFGQLHWTSREDQNRLVGMDIFPYVQKALGQLKKNGLRISVIIPESLSAEDLRGANEHLGVAVSVLAMKNNLRTVLHEQIREY